MTQTRARLMVTTGYMMTAIVEHIFPGNPTPPNPVRLRKQSHVCARAAALQPCVTAVFSFPALDNALPVSQGVHGGGRDVPGGGDQGDQSDQGPQAAPHAPVAGVETPAIFSLHLPARHSAAPAPQTQSYPPHPPRPPTCYHHSGGPAPC